MIVIYLFVVHNHTNNRFICILTRSFEAWEIYEITGH